MELISPLCGQGDAAAGTVEVSEQGPRAGGLNDMPTEKQILKAISDYYHIRTVDNSSLAPFAGV